MNITAIIPRQKKFFIPLWKWLLCNSVCSAMSLIWHFERGDQGVDSLDYIVFRLDWVINILVRYLGTERTDPRVIDLLCEVKDMINSSQCTSSCTARTLLTGYARKTKVKCSERTAIELHLLRYYRLKWPSPQRLNSSLEP